VVIGLETSSNIFQDFVQISVADQGPISRFIIAPQKLKYGGMNPRHLDSETGRNEALHNEN
jgi:hypothetical protein